MNVKTPKNSEQEVEAPKWRKILYEKQEGFPDNHVDLQSFLDGRLVKPPQIDPIDKVMMLWRVCMSANVVVKQVALVGIFIGVYKQVVVLDSCFGTLISLDIGLACSGFFFHRYLDHLEGRNVNHSLSDMLQGLKHLSLMTCLLRLLAPLLHTLTSPYSENTIHALAIIFSCIHLVTFDYAYIAGTVMGDSPVTHRVVYRGSMSMSAAILLAILLVSRLRDVYTVYAFLLLALLLFVLQPWTARCIMKLSRTLDLCSTVVVCVVAAVLLHSVSAALFMAFIVVLTLVWLVGPLTIVAMYPRRHIKALHMGPWDLS